MKRKGWLTSERTTKFIGFVLCFITFLCVYGLTSRSDIQSGDEAATFATGISLATKGDFAIDSLSWLLQKDASIGQLGRGGHLYSRFFPGTSLGIAFLYNLMAHNLDKPYIWGGLETGLGDHVMAPSQFGAHFALRLNAILGAFGIAMLLLLLKRYFPWKTVFISVLLFGLCTDWWYQSRGVFLEVGAGAFLMAAIYFADREEPYLSGLMLAISLIFRPTNIFALPIWGYAVWKKGWKSLWSVAFILISLCLLIVYNYVRFKSLFDFGYGGEGFTSPLIQGLVGVLISPGRSVFFYSPIVILAITGGRYIFKKDRLKLILLLVPVVCYLLLISSWHNWDGGASWGSRLLTPILPILGVMIGTFTHQLILKPKLASILVVILLGCIGVGIQLLTITCDPLMVLIDYIGSGYANYSQSVISFDKNWLALQLMNLTHWNWCKIDAYTLRNIWTACR